MARICEGDHRAMAIAISDPLLDDMTILVSSALMLFGPLQAPKGHAMETVREPLDCMESHDSLPNGDGA